MPNGPYGAILGGMADSLPSRAQDGELSAIDEMLADMIADGMTMVDACAELGLNRRMLYKRLAKDGPFAELLDGARIVGYEAIAERSRKVVRGEAGYSTGDVKRDKLIAEQDNKLLSKWHPQRYGDKIEVQSTNRNLAVPISDDPIEAARQYRELTGG